ncbi:hypothetical protein [Nitrosomonas sp. Is79A3]|uniref:hypothetical protein n=1 Tax=Nitrosomonas sp. (strain Is79A3) TaxID=261292 RepID=UPI003298F6D4
MCQYAASPGYRHKSVPVSPKPAPFTGIIDAILEADKQVHFVYTAAVRQKEMLCRWRTSLVMPR